MNELGGCCHRAFFVLVRRLVLVLSGMNISFN